MERGEATDATNSPQCTGRPPVENSLAPNVSGCQAVKGHEGG